MFIGGVRKRDLMFFSQWIGHFNPRHAKRELGENIRHASRGTWNGIEFPKRRRHQIRSKESLARIVFGM